ncbi:MAG: site-specific integrase [Candidatus Thermoplasmatota archaeon]|nr:site-specific integrase [Candidatus Thermoplasmatota archaeon]
MNEKILERYWQHLRGKYRKKGTRRVEYTAVKLCLQWINKPVNQITKQDLNRWKTYIIEHFKPNGNSRRVSCINHFFKWYGKKHFKLPTPKQEMTNKIVLSDKELNDYLEASKKDPLWHMIALMQIDVLIRPGELRDIKINNIDFDNQKLYLDDTKTGDNYIIMSPRLSEAIKNYLPYRNPLPEYKDYLLIVPTGNYIGKRLGEQAAYVKTLTRKIAVEAKITKQVTPYIIKPSAITNDFNKNINPRIIQRKARHKNIETTLRYDHTDDEMVKRYFNQQKPSFGSLDNEEKTRVMLDQFLKGEIDLETYKQSIDLLHKKDRDSGGVGYV